MLVFGIILLIAGALLLLNYFRSKKRLEEITAAETATAASLQAVCQGVADEIGKGSFEQKTEVKGVIECDQPVESELAKESCVHYRMTVERKWEEDYEEEYTETDANGNQITKTRQATRTGADTVASNSRSVKFSVRDETGAILVDPEGAEIDVEKVVDRFESQTSFSGGKISFGGFSLSLGGGADTGRRRTLGYHFSEAILSLNRQVYVLGEASDRSGTLMIQKPREKGKFIISLKSEEELAASAKSGMTWSLYISIACFILGIILIISDLI